MKKTLILALALAALCGMASAQTDRDPETNPVILDRIDQWQDLKFGFMMHWGIYAQWGVVESWSICSEPWIDRKGMPYEEYKNRYQALNKTFNPTRFNPAAMAAAAKNAGMKYMVFTTKHHDGFCMFRSAETDYSVAGVDCPYSRNPQPDITLDLVNAFRAQGLWTGLYFSKPDWHHRDYWAPEWATPDRNVNYDIPDHPDRWENFKRFTHNQIRELTHNYGDIDILWLDGGWIRPEWSINDETRPWLGCSQRVQDIDMDALAAIARADNPDLIIVVPDTLLPYPWETCMTMGDSWSYVPSDHYKSTTQLIHMLADVVAKGGNLLLNVGPDAQGNLPPQALERMEQIGVWLSANGRAIYATRPLYPYCHGNVRFTQSKDGNHRYAICLLDEPVFELPFKVKKARFVAPLKGSKMKCTPTDGGSRLEISLSTPQSHAIVTELF